VAASRSEPRARAGVGRERPDARDASALEPYMEHGRGLLLVASLGARYGSFVLEGSSGKWYGLRCGRSSFGQRSSGCIITHAPGYDNN